MSALPDISKSTATAAMRRVWAMPSAETFSIPPIRALVKSYLHASKVSVDPFARNKRWATHTNDLNPETAAECHMEALEFLSMLKRRGVIADLGLFDPPYSLRQVTECYAGVGVKATATDTQAAWWRGRRDALDALIKPGGVVISCGWNSGGMGTGRGYELVELLVVNHGGVHNDTICTVERKAVSAQVTMFPDLQRISASSGHNSDSAESLVQHLP